MSRDRAGFVKSTFDHAWSVGLQSHWEDEEGFVHIRKLQGGSERKKPKNRKIYGKQRGHELVVKNVGNPWNFTFEPMFDRCDDRVHQIVRQLKDKSPPCPDPILNKLAGNRVELSDFTYNTYLQSIETYRDFLELAFSLIVRSRRFREIYSSAGSNFGLKPDPLIGQANIQHKFSWIQANLRSLNRINGYVILLTSSEEEFVYSDGIHASLKIVCPIVSGEAQPHLSGEALLPITPDLCAFVTASPMEIVAHNVLSLHVRKSEARLINSLTRLNAVDELFCRNMSDHVNELVTQVEKSSAAEAGLAFLECLKRLPAYGRHIA